MKALFFYPLASIAALFVLSSAEGESQGCSGYRLPPPKRWFTFTSRPYCKTAAYYELKHMPYYVDAVSASENVKHEKWNNWLKEMKISLTEKLEKESQEYMEKLEQQWDEFMKNSEDKWRHYNPQMEEEYQCSVYPLGLKWDDEKWTAWFYEKGLWCLKKSFKTWLTDSKKGYNTYMKNLLQEFGKQFYEDWCRRPEKRREDKICKRWGQKGLRNDNYYALKLMQWRNWSNRNHDQKHVWVTLMKDALKEYTGPEFKLWTEFRKEKIDFYKQWMQAFAEQWTQDKQWNTWTEERNEYMKKKKEEEAKKKAASKKGGAAKKAPAKKAPTKKAAPGTKAPAKKAAPKKVAAPNAA
ncbi:tryptophan-rich antigen [Plasmodium vivax]|uniref:Tryptophan-rich antigen n=1 Tax=Plasmodium vivax TaxID=5855 RepID=A0A1G4GYD6_PLAVI|nr:tryptophan-rich antigen [Plasmodium vivax]SCO72964.1 tryptophan-rich antigen [Plasmodium vivax]